MRVRHFAATLLAAVSLSAVSHAATPPGAQVVAIAPSASVDFEVFLPLRNKPALETLLKAQTTPGSASYHQWLTPAQFGAQFGPSAASFANVRAAVVSAPCFELFRRQSREYRTAVLGRVPRIGVEAAIEGEWARWLGDDGEFVGMTGFGASAPAETLYREFGITPEAVAKAATRCVARKRMAETYS